MTSNREIRILADANSIAQTAAAEFLEAARDSIREKGSFSIALAGGSTPKALYGLLASNPLLQAKVPWSKIQFFFGDERHVPPDHAESNFRMAKEAMLVKAPIDSRQVHRIKGEKREAAEAAVEYEDDLRRQAVQVATRALGGSTCAIFSIRRRLILSPRRRPTGRGSSLLLTTGNQETL
jgi:6-phosphogluconolactonase/glucosamine-6-phosphate isomerase/deaminase